MTHFYEGEVSGISFSAGAWPPMDGLPTLIFIHGSGGDRSLWEKQLTGLSKKFNVVALDLPGHGGTSSPQCATIPEYAAEVAGFIRAASLPMPVPCGLSIGGGIALQLVLVYPDEAVELASVVRVMEATPPEVTAGDFRACDAFDVSPRLGEIKIPVLVISALEDKLTPPKYGEFLRDNIEGARLVLIPGVGHLLPLEAPHRLNDSIREFLEAAI